MHEDETLTVWLDVIFCVVVTSPAGSRPAKKQTVIVAAKDRIVVLLFDLMFDFAVVADFPLDVDHLRLSPMIPLPHCRSNRKRH